jgi:lycopene cyclase domain-containing protein
VRHLAYLGMLAFCVLGTVWLELILGVRVLRRLRRLVLTLLPVLMVFAGWDLYAIAAGHWDFDAAQTMGLVLPGGLPLEELLFFVVIPLCALLTLEGVRALTRWPVGDGGPDGVRRPVLRRSRRTDAVRSSGSRDGT